jgi:molybdate transport system substrate-binding protein
MNASPIALPGSPLTTRRLAVLAALLLTAGAVQAQAPAPKATLRLLTAGAFKEVVLALLPAFQTQSGVKVDVASDTVGGLVRRIGDGQQFDVVFASQDGLKRLAAAGQISSASLTEVASVGIGMRAGAAAPPLSTTAEFIDALRAARAVAYIDPASGGSSGIYLNGLFQRLQIADMVQAKAVLVPGGLAAERVARGEADIVLQQASEILPVRGVMLVGELPASIQSRTTYGGAIAAASALPQQAQALLAAFTAASAAPVIRGKGMEPTH